MYTLPIPYASEDLLNERQKRVNDTHVLDIAPARHEPLSIYNARIRFNFRFILSKEEKQYYYIVRILTKYILDKKKAIKLIKRNYPVIASVMSSWSDWGSSVIKFLTQFHVYTDVFKQDLLHSRDTAIVLLNNENVYYGHVYVWESSESSDTLMVIGIRTSVINYLSQEVRGVAQLLFSGVSTFAKFHNYTKIQVEAPIGPMSRILSQMGFEHVEKLKDMVINVSQLKI